MKRCSHSLAYKQQTSDAAQIQRRHLPQPAAAIIHTSGRHQQQQNKGPAVAAPDHFLDKPRKLILSPFIKPL